MSFPTVPGKSANAGSRASSETTVAETLLQALIECESEYLFVNLGTDHTPLIEALAKRDMKGALRPKVVLCPHETVALSMAHGYAQATGRAQTVLVHVDVGTQHLGGAVHNVARTRVPVVILAGLAPVTESPDTPGSRDMFVHYIQDMSDQAGIVRPYIKWEYEMRHPSNAVDVLRRAFRVANEVPGGPVYLSVTREILEQSAEPAPCSAAWSVPAARPVLDDASLELVVDWLSNAELPVAVTSYVGRRPEAVDALVGLAEAAAMPVMEAAPHCYMNFPGDHPLHVGPRDRHLLERADFLLLLDCDVPWIPSNEHPNDRARVVHLDIDPLKPQLPLWTYRVDLAAQVDAGETLVALRRRLEQRRGPSRPDRVKKRSEALAEEIDTKKGEAGQAISKPGPEGPMSAAWLTARLNELIPQETVVVEELVSNAVHAARHLKRTLPGTHFASGGSGIGWGLAAAAGIKLAQPASDVVCLLGDGAFLFAPPSSALWVAREYGTPFLTVVYNNRGWAAPSMATRLQHPEGFAVGRNDFASSFGPGIDLAELAKSIGCHGERVQEPNELEAAMERGRAAVKAGNIAVVDVLIEPVGGTRPA